MEHIFGPVPSRRLGFSLGIDLVPFKVCSLDCLYCQVGNTTLKTLERKSYIPLDAVIAELREVLTRNQKISYITLSGSGEPTLNLHLGEVIAAVKGMTDIPLAVLTNGTLLHLESVREELRTADVVLPSLDTVSPEVFRALNRPHPELDVSQMISGLRSFRNIFSGELWLEIMVVKGFNDAPEEIKRIGEVLATIECDKIQLNTVVRPTTDRHLAALTYEELAGLKALLGERCEVIGGFTGEQRPSVNNIPEKLIMLMSRRPLNLAEISDSLGLPQERVNKYLSELSHQGKIESRTYGSELYYRIKR